MKSYTLRPDTFTLNFNFIHSFRYSFGVGNGSWEMGWGGRLSEWFAARADVRRGRGGGDDDEERETWEMGDKGAERERCVCERER